MHSGIRSEPLRLLLAEDAAPRVQFESLKTTPALSDPPLAAKKVAIVGFAESSRYEAPWHDPEFEIWGLNMAHAWMPTWHRLFEMHDRATLELETEECKRETDHLGVLTHETTRVIYMLEPQADIPRSVRYPIEDVVEFFGKRCPKLAAEPYFTSTPGYMLALAIVKGAEEIHCYGIDLLHDEEYAYQRANFEFLCGVAIGCGITLHVPLNSAALASDGLYGYGNAANLALLARLQAKYAAKIKRLTEKREEAAQRREQAKADYNSFDGARQMLEELSAQLTFLMRGGRI